MKKILLFIFAAMLATSVHAQINFGAKVGGNLSNAYTKNIGRSFDPRFGFHLGGIVDFSLPAVPIGIQPELLYIYNGVNSDGNNSGVSEYVSFHQIQLPVNVKLKIGTKMLGFYATLGPYVSYIAAGNFVVGDNDVSIFDDSFQPNFNRWDYGLGVGAGIRVLKFMVGADFKYGFANLIDEGNASFHLWNLSLSVGYLF